MRENDTLEIIKNSSFLTDNPAAATTMATTTTATATTITTEYKKTTKEKDDFSFNFNSQHISRNYHNSPLLFLLQDSEFYLIKYNTPLKPKINQIQCRINNEIVKFQNIFNKLKIQDTEEIKKLVISIKENNIQYSSLISSELSVIRKTSKAVWTTKIVLDNLYNEICNVSSFKDLVEIITPSLTIMKSIRSLLIPHIRESEHDFKNISDLLCDVLFNAGQIGGYLINFKLANDTALNTINEALFKAENKIKAEFLPIPDIMT
jgi:hypothetical protein